MDANVHFTQQKKMERTKQALEKNNIACTLAASAKDVVPLLQAIIPQGAAVSNGGSATLESCGVNAFFRKGGYRYLDRDDPAENKAQVQFEAFGADFYLASANAVTEAGEVYAVDGVGNRVAALAYGPKKVVLVVGRNKIVPDLAEARQRRRRVAAPANARRLSTDTPCATTGICSDCTSPQRICCIELVLSFQRLKDRVHVILVDEELGF